MYSTDELQSFSPYQFGSIPSSIMWICVSEYMEFQWVYLYYDGDDLKWCARCKWDFECECECECECENEYEIWMLSWWWLLLWLWLLLLLLFEFMCRMDVKKTYKAICRHHFPIYCILEYCTNVQLSHVGYNLIEPFLLLVPFIANE